MEGYRAFSIVMALWGLTLMSTGETFDVYEFVVVGVLTIQQHGRITLETVGVLPGTLPILGIGGKNSGSRVDSCCEHFLCMTL